MTSIAPGSSSEMLQKEAQELKTQIKVVMFDQYGTVVDMQKGLTEIAAPFLKAKGWTGNPSSFVTWWRRTHFENSMIDALLHKEHTSYREIGQRAVAYTMDRAGITYTPDEVRYLVGCIEELKCFPDVPEALARLQSRYKIVVLSNGDPDMLEAAKAHHRVPFDRIISVAEAQSFKPHVATYTKAAGMYTAFIDRRKRPFGGTPHQPDLWVDDMKSLADLMV